MPDIYDSAKYDAIHNSELGLDIHDLYKVRQSIHTCWLKVSIILCWAMSICSLLCKLRGTFLLPVAVIDSKMAYLPPYVVLAQVPLDKGVRDKVSLLPSMAGESPSGYS